MSESRDPLSPFDATLVERVAADCGVEVGVLRDLAVRHQQGMRELPGVDNLVYEWRKYYPYDPIVARTERAFYAVVFAAVWDEFADRLGLTEPEQSALTELHDRQTRATLRKRGEDTGVLEGAAALVVTRP
jgi:hypothetical protein